MDIRRLTPDDGTAWSALLAAAFARPQAEMGVLLDWLGVGFPMIAWGAWDGARLAAQYSCLVVALHIDGAPVRAGMSVNMATHPDYRGRGLIKQVAQPVYEALAKQGVVAGVGFSNAAGVQVDRHSKGYGYRVVGQLQPVVALLPLFTRNSPTLRLTDHFPGAPEICPGERIQFMATPRSIAHRFGCHPFRRYQFGVWCEHDRVCGLVVYRSTQIGGVAGVALMAAYGDDLPELLRRWMYSLRGVRFVHVLTSPHSRLRTALKQAAPCIALAYSRTPYYLTAKPLRPDTPDGLFDLSQWDCAGGDLL